MDRIWFVKQRTFLTKRGNIALLRRNTSHFFATITHYVALLLYYFSHFVSFSLLFSVRFVRSSFVGHTEAKALILRSDIRDIYISTVPLTIYSYFESLMFCVFVTLFLSPSVLYVLLRNVLREKSQPNVTTFYDNV